MTKNIDLSQYPALMAGGGWGTVRWTFPLCDSVPDPALVTNINLVPRIGEDWVALYFDEGEWSVPGGTREPGEEIMDTLRRELLEEAGAKLVDFHLFGLMVAHNSAPEPYRPHLPHPINHRLIGVGEVEILGKPGNPADGEKVLQVEVVKLDQALTWFREKEQGWLAELYQLAEVFSRQA